MICHYEVFGLPFSATADEIKKKYRKLALQFHPDKNVGKEEEATEKFKEVTSAYTVLSDAQERRWYDDHREAILRGGDGTRDEEAESFVVDLWSYFSPACCSGPYECDTGFYAVYHNLFIRLMESENDKLDEEQTAEGAPEFNDADSSSKEVYAFYNHWTKFVTKMSFSWEDKYNPKDVPNRQVRRAIEKENKKFRDIEKKKYNDIVRQLVAYIRKRDPRVVKFEVQARVKKEDEDRKKLETKLEAELRRKEKRELSRIALENNGEEVMRRAEERVGAFLLADYESDDDDNDLNLAEDDIEDIKAQADYASLNVVESTPLEENDYDSGGGEGEKAELCEICSKKFKTKAQLLQHLNSKNHRKKEQEMGKKSKKNGKNNEKLSENGSKSGSNWKIRPEIVSQNSDSESDHDNNEIMNENEKKVDNEMLNKKEIGIMNKKDKKNKKKTESLFQFLSDDSDDDTDVNKKNNGNEVNEDYDSDNDKKKNKGKTDNDDKESIIDYATASLRKLKIEKDNDKSDINDDVTDNNIQDNIAEKSKNKYKKKEKLGYFGKSSLTEKPLIPVFDEALPVSILDENDVVTMKGPQRKKVKKISLRGF